MKKNNEQLKISVILSYAISVIQVLIQLIYTPIVLTYLGQKEYGLYTLVGSVVSYLTLCGLGFSSAYLRFYSRYSINNDEYGIAKINGLFLTINCIVAACSSLLGGFLVIHSELVLGKNLSNDEHQLAKILMIILIVNIAVTFINTIFDSIIVAHEAFLFQRIIRLISVIANPILALPLLFLGYNSIALVSITTGISLLTLVVNILYCFFILKIRIKLGTFDKELFVEIVTFSFFVFINMIIDQINWNVDKLLLGRFCGTLAVAIYGIGAQLNNIDINLSLSVSSVFGPRVNQIGASGEYKERFTKLFIKTGRIQCMIMLLLDSGLVLFGKQFIELWAGEGYQESYWVMILLVIPAFIPCIQNIGLEMQRAINKHQFRSIAYLVMALVNVGLSIPLCKMYGAIGAASGTTISLIIGNGIIMNWFYYKKMGIDIWEFWKNIFCIFKGVVGPIIMYGILIKHICINNWIILSVSILGYVVLYSIFAYLFSMNESEKEIISGIIERLRIRKIAN